MLVLRGDTLQVKDGYLHINGELAYQPEHKQYLWVLAGVADAISRDPRGAYTEHGLFQNAQGNWLTFRSEKEIERLKTSGLFKQAFIDMSETHPKGNIKNLEYFPNTVTSNWTPENFGPLVIPAKGKSIAITPENAAIYKRPILVYEKNDFCWKEGMIYQSDCTTPLTEYTFNMDYYWFMGDNRHNSQDSRYWGFVPEDHVVGKAWFVVLSTDNTKSSIFQKIRWNRFFRGIHSNWAPKEDTYRY